MASQAALKLVGKDDGDKQRALEAAIAQIDRAFGKGSVMKLGKAGVVAEIDSVSTGSLGLDMALGIGGLPRGRVIEVFCFVFLRKQANWSGSLWSPSGSRIFIMIGPRSGLVHR